MPPDGVISVGTLSTDTVLHVFDSDSALANDCPHLTIGGDPNGHSLMVQVVSSLTNGTTTDNVFLNQQPTVRLDAGVRNFGGVSFASDALRDHAVVAVSVQGDITGNIDAAQVWRIEAQQDEGGNYGGRILGNITAWQKNNSIVPTSGCVALT